MEGQCRVHLATESTHSRMGIWNSARIVIGTIASRAKNCTPRHQQQIQIRPKSRRNEMNQGGKIGRVRVQPAILKYFSEVPGEEIWIDDLVNSTPFDEKQIQSAITRLIANGYDVRTVIPGRPWPYHALPKPPTPPNPET